MGFARQDSRRCFYPARNPGLIPDDEPPANRPPAECGRFRFRSPVATRARGYGAACVPARGHGAACPPALAPFSFDRSAPTGRRPCPGDAPPCPPARRSANCDLTPISRAARLERFAWRTSTAPPGRQAPRGRPPRPVNFHFQLFRERRLHSSFGVLNQPPHPHPTAPRRTSEPAIDRGIDTTGD